MAHKLTTTEDGRDLFLKREGLCDQWESKTLSTEAFAAAMFNAGLRRSFYDPRYRMTSIEAQQQGTDNHVDERGTG